MNVDLEHLRCFVAAANHLSFRAAARELALSPAAFGQRVRLVEEQLGVALFTRTTRSVALTVEGARALDAAREALGAAARFVEVARGGARPPFTLTLGTRFEIGLSWIVPALPALERLEPARALHVVFGDGPDLVARTLAGELDATLTSARLAVPRLRMAALHEEAYAFVGARRLLRDKPLRGAGDARAMVLLDATAELPLFRYFLDVCPADETWSFERVELLSTTAALRLRVLQGAGVAVLPRSVVERDVEAGRLEVLMPKRRLARDRYRLVWRAGHPRELELAALAADLARAS